MASFINIGGDKNDLSFRYKMPVLQIKTEGRGNGIKTLILNLYDISKSLYTKPEYIAKFFSIEIGCSYKFESPGCAYLNGSHSLLLLSSYLDKFVKMFILCPICSLPELSLFIKKGNINIICSSCGHNNYLKNSHKLTSYIIKYPPEINSCVNTQISNRNNISHFDRKIDDDIEDIEWMEKDDIIVSIIDEIKMQKIISVQYLQSIIRNNKDELLSLKIEREREYMESIEKNIERIGLKFISIFLQEFYDMSVFSEEFIISWYESERSEKIRKYATTFVEWLKNAEEED